MSAFGRGGSRVVLVAAFALVAAVAGTAIAGSPDATTSISKKSVKKIAKKLDKKQDKKNFPLDSSKLSDGAVTTQKIGDGAVTAEKIGPGTLDKSTVVRTFLANTAGNGTLGEGEVGCNTGEQLVSGGGGWVNNANPPTSYVLDGTVSDSGPSAPGDTPIADGATPQNWHVSGINTSGANARIYVYAVCQS